VQKPGEEGFDRRIAKLHPDGVLIRHWGALIHFLERSDDIRPKLHGDFSLNVTNSVTAAHLLALGLDTFTASHDLDEHQLSGLLDAVPRHRSAVTIHHHIPTFHTEHCVYSANLSEGRDYRSCGRPCDRHRVALRDREGRQHPVVVDVGCRNTVFNAAAQTAASLARSLAERGVSRLRAEFVWESREETLLVIQAYSGLLDGSLSPAECLARIGAHEQFGVTAGTMRTLSPDVGPTASRHGHK
jgi:putative protease